MLGDPKIIATTGWTTDELSAALDVFDASQAPVPALVGAASAASSLVGVGDQKLAAEAAPTRSKADSDALAFSSLLIGVNNQSRGRALEESRGRLSSMHEIHSGYACGLLPLCRV